MAGKSESISAYDMKNADVLTPFTSIPSCERGEFDGPGTNAVVADLSARSFTETTQTGDGAPR